MKIRITKTINTAKCRIPAGTVLKFVGTEALYRGMKIRKSMIPGLEDDLESVSDDPESVSDETDFGKIVVDLLTEKYPNGFTANQLSEDLGDKINGAIYALSDDDDETNEAVLTLTTDDDKEIKVSLAKDETDTYTLTGKYECKDCEEVSAAMESFLGKLVLSTRK